jgi:hypothetical protein
LLLLLQMQLPVLTPAQLVIALASMCEMGGRPPQAWLASHETALLNTNSRSPSNEALSPKVRVGSHMFMHVQVCLSRICCMVVLADQQRQVA